MSKALYCTRHALRSLKSYAGLFLWVAEYSHNLLLLSCRPGEDEPEVINWDIPAHRESILRRELPLTEMWYFDEIHKYGSWRDFLKGVYNEFHQDHRILVTGSVRQDMLR